MFLRYFDLGWTCPEFYEDESFKNGGEVCCIVVLVQYWLKRIRIKTDDIVKVFFVFESPLGQEYRRLGYCTKENDALSVASVAYPFDFIRYFGLEMPFGFYAPQ